MSIESIYTRSKIERALEKYEWQRLADYPRNFEWYKPGQLGYTIGNHKDGACLQLHGQASKQPKRCRSAMLDPKGRAFLCVSGPLFSTRKPRPI